LGNFLTRLCCLQESGFRVHWKNMSRVQQGIGLTPSFPAKVCPVDLNEHSGEIFIKGGAFMAATDPNLSFEFEKAGRNHGGTCGKGIFGGQGFFINKVSGSGWIFLNASGTVLRRDLAPHEVIVVEQQSVVAWESTVRFDYKMAGGAGMMCCGGEGLTNATLTGPGLVILQSMPFEKVREIIIQGNQNASGGKNPVARFVGIIILILIVFANFVLPAMVGHENQ